MCVCGAELNADTSLALRHYGIVETGDVDTLLLHFGGEVLRQFCIVEHHGADGALRGLDVESGIQHLLTEICHILHQTVVQVVALVEHPEHLEACSDNCGSHRVGEEVGTRALTQHVDYLLGAGCETSHGAAERFAQRTGEDVDPAVCVELLCHTAATFADNAGAVALVDHHQGVILLGQIADLVDRCHIAVHREHAVGGDDAVTAILSFLEATFQILHVGILIAETFGLAEAHAVDDRGMVERIADYGVLLGEQRLEQTAVSIETGGVQYGVLRLEIFADGTLQLLVQVLRAANEAHGTHAVATLVHSPLGRFDQAAVVGQAEIVVGAEIKHLSLLSVALNLDVATLRSHYDTLVLVQSGILDGRQLLLQMFLEVLIHGNRFI